LFAQIGVPHGIPNELVYLKEEDGDDFESESRLLNVDARQIHIAGSEVVRACNSERKLKGGQDLVLFVR